MDLQKARENIWPSIIDSETAKKAAYQGFWVALLCALATAFMVVFSIVGHTLMGVDAYALVDVLAFAIIAACIRLKLSRSAAVLGLLLYILERIVMWSESGIKNPVIAILFITALINGVRGTFAYHKFTKSAAVKKAKIL